MAGSDDKRYGTSRQRCTSSRYTVGQLDIKILQNPSVPPAGLLQIMNSGSSRISIPNLYRPPQLLIRETPWPIGGSARPGPSHAARELFRKAMTLSGYASITV